MITQAARTESLAAAISDTFSGEMCDLCRIVTKAHQDDKSPAPLLALKLEARPLLYFQPAPAIVIAPPGATGLVSMRLLVDSQGRPMPPVPPPRAAAD